jgi:hypothetical protein
VGEGGEVGDVDGEVAVVCYNEEDAVWTVGGVEGVVEGAVE